MDLSSMLNDVPATQPLPLLNTATKQPLLSKSSADYSRTSIDHAYRDQPSPPYFTPMKPPSPQSPTDLRTQPFAPSQFARESPTVTNGGPHPPPQQRPLSPSLRFLSHPATPLGPPPSAPKPPPPTNRPPSQGLDGPRAHSRSSLPPTYEHEHTLHYVSSPEGLRRDALQRRFTSDMDGERSASASVSPKTIPIPSPHRQMGSNSVQLLYYSTPTQAEDSRLSMQDSGSMSNGQPRGLRQSSEATSASMTPKETQPSLPTPSRPSPVSSTSQHSTPKVTNAQIPSKDSPQTRKQPSLKRNASVLSTHSASPLPTRKRLRRSEIPIYAQSARPDNPPILTRGPHAQFHQSSATTSAPAQTKDVGSTNGNHADSPAKTWDVSLGEPSIFDMVPFEEIPQQICEWIDRTIGHAKPLPNGAVFEIEAKLGEIFDIEGQHRLRLPVATTTVFLKEQYPRDTKFNSSMNVQQHQKLNKYLNDLVVRQSHLFAQGHQVAPIEFEHLREQDEFFELDAADVEALPAEVRVWFNKRHQIKVRRTTDQKTDAIKAQIIKSRIGDLDVYNPRAAFDYRISISIEIPWQGDASLLRPALTSGRERKKDRMSYHHLAYQIDLTQVSSRDTLEKEHELEIELDSDIIREQLEQMALGVEPTTKYANFIPGLVHYVHGLCGKGS